MPNTDRRLNLCLFTTTFLPKLGGQELVVDALARELTLRGHRVVVLAPHPRVGKRGGDATHPTLLDPTLPYPVVRHMRYVSSRFFLGLYQRYLHHAARQFGHPPGTNGQRHAHFDLVHCHDTFPTGYLATLAKAGKVVITSHGGDLNEGNVRIVKPGVLARCRHALEHADHLVSIGRFTEANYRRVTPKLPPMTTIPNGVYLQELSGGVEDPPPEDLAMPYFLYLGRLHPRKGVDVLLRAVEGGGLNVVVTGDGPERSKLETMAPREIQDGRVRFLGRRSGAQKTWLLRHAAAVVMPSVTWEAFPLVVMEAAAAGTPVIASDVPGLADLVRHERTGLVVPPGDPGALRGAMMRLVGDEPLRARLGAEARAHAAGYDWERVVSEYEALYQRVVAGER